MLRADIIGVILAGGAAALFLDAVDPKLLRTIFGIVAQVGGTLLGFVVAAMAILMALPDSRFTSNLRKTGHMQKLLRQMFWSAVWALLVVLLAVTMMFAPLDALQYCAIAVLGALGGTVARLLVAGHRFYVILEVLSDTDVGSRLK